LFLLSGELEIATDEGARHYVAPCYVNAPEGTKRVLHALQDSVFVNVYPNPDNITDIETLEDTYSLFHIERTEGVWKFGLLFFIKFIIE
jgi:hypothetical protein